MRISPIIVALTLFAAGCTSGASSQQSNQARLPLVASQAAVLGTLPFKEYPLPKGASGPEGIAAGPDGALWFAEYDSNQIGRITTGGSITEYPVPTTFGLPRAIVAGSDGALWFTEEFADKIGRITTSGVISEFPIPGPHAGPLDIASGSDGALWFTEFNSNEIGRISTGGAITQFQVPTPNAGLYYIAAGPDAALWFTEFQGNQVGRITTGGTITEFPVGQTPSGIAAGPDGAIWFCEINQHRIARITTSGTIREFPFPPSYGKPTAITARPPGGALWFTTCTKCFSTSYFISYIGRITTGGAFSFYRIPTRGANPFFITEGPDLALWFTERAKNKIGRFGQ